MFPCFLSVQGIGSQMAGVSDGKMGPQAMISGTRVIQTVGIYCQQLVEWSHFQKNQSNTVKLIFFLEEGSQNHCAATAAPF